MEKAILSVFGASQVVLFEPLGGTERLLEDIWENGIAPKWTYLMCTFSQMA